VCASSDFVGVWRRNVFYEPVIEDNNPAPISAADSPADVLLVSSDAQYRASLRDICGRMGSQLYEARSNREGLNVLSRTHIPVVLCERRFWKDMLSYLAPLADAPRVIVLTPGVDAEFIPEARNMGIFGVVSLTLSPDEIVSTMRGACRSWWKEHGHARERLLAAAG